MCHSRTLNYKINKLHQKALRVVYKNDNLSFLQLLEKDNSITIHDRNRQKLAVKMYKVKNHLSPLPVQDTFKRQGNTPNLRNDKCWETPESELLTMALKPLGMGDQKHSTQRNKRVQISNRIQNKNQALKATGVHVSVL